jgi:hypothetical protein
MNTNSTPVPGAALRAAYRWEVDNVWLGRR